MKCELLAESNLALLPDFIDDMNTKYDVTVLKAFLDETELFLMKDIDFRPYMTNGTDKVNKN